MTGKYYVIGGSLRLNKVFTKLAASSTTGAAPRVVYIDAAADIPNDHASTATISNALQESFSEGDYSSDRGDFLRLDLSPNDAYNKTESITRRWGVAGGHAIFVTSESHKDMGLLSTESDDTNEASFYIDGNFHSPKLTKH